jgi:serine/threonine protein kinase
VAPIRPIFSRSAKGEDAHVHVTDDPRVGAELAGYRIESLLGWGGMSVVYLAEDLRLKRKVALKLLAASLAEDESFRERFLRESELAASIDHPNIVPIYEAGATEDLLYIAMRYVGDRDLKERLRQSRLEPSDAIGILAQVASALDAAHARGLVHRDVKPSNVLLDRGARPDGSDHVYLADFGLTRRVSDKSGIGDDGHLLGTIDYARADRRGRSRRTRRRLLARLCALRVRGRTAAVPPRLRTCSGLRAPRNGSADAERPPAGVARRASTP